MMPKQRNLDGEGRGCQEKSNLALPSLCPKGAFAVRVSENCLAQVSSTVGMHEKWRNGLSEHVVSMEYLFQFQFEWSDRVCFTPLVCHPQCDGFFRWTLHFYHQNFPQNQQFLQIFRMSGHTSRPVALVNVFKKDKSADLADFAPLWSH